MLFFGICSSTARKLQCESGRRRDKHTKLRSDSVSNLQIIENLYPFLSFIQINSVFLGVSPYIFSNLLLLIVRKRNQRQARRRTTSTFTERIPELVREATMAAKLTKAISSIEQSAPVTQHSAQVIDVESVKCDCCGLTEECTPAYIARVRERHEGRWVCGLCAEAVKDESLRSQSNITTGEAVKRHMKFHKAFKSSIPPRNPTEDLISAMKQLLRRSLDSPKKDASRSLGRSNSCFSAMPGRRSHYDD